MIIIMSMLFSQLSLSVRAVSVRHFCYRNVISINVVLKLKIKTDKSEDIVQVYGKILEHPLEVLEGGGTVDFNSVYTLKRGHIYNCTNEGFGNQRAPINERKCKHSKEYNGEEFEKCRQKTNTLPKPSNSKSCINISLLLPAYTGKYDEQVHDPVGWWMSEKLDGVRAFWNGSCLYSKPGKPFSAPEWFTKDLPRDMTLDGELFGGRGQYFSTQGLARSKAGLRWNNIVYHVFDSPSMGTEVFEKRMTIIKEYFDKSQPKYAVFVEQTKCRTKEHLKEMLTRILNLGGEGLMIRQPKSVYEPYRSKTLLKVKKFHGAEALVIDHVMGKGDKKDRCRSLRCRMAGGKEFSVGSGLACKDRINPPKIGSIVRYKYQDLTKKKGIPRTPVVFLGVCPEKTQPKDAKIPEVLDEDEV